MAKSIKPILPIKPPRIIRCPDPQKEVLCPTKPYFDSSEFSSSQLTNSHGHFNGTTPNTKFLHTIIWKPKHRCCQVIHAKVKVKMRSIIGGQSPTSSDAGNDGISIVKDGGTAIVSQPIYNSHSFGPGTNTTKIFYLSGSQLNWLNTNKKLSIYVQDDTSVRSIEVELRICCLSKITKG